MRLRRVLACALTLVLAFCLAPAGEVVKAAGSAEITITASPEELSKAGKVDLSFILRNKSQSAAMEEITIDGPGVSQLPPMVAPGESSEVFCENVDISDSQLGKALTYTVEWKENGRAYSFKPTVTVKKDSRVASLTLKRTADKTEQNVGQPVIFTYELKNTGDLELSDVAVKDVFSDVPIAQGITLAPGKSQVFTQSQTMHEGLISRPTVSYVADGNPLSKSVDELAILIPKNVLSLVVSPNKELVNAGEEITLTCTLRNTGKTALSDIIVTDENGVEISSGLTCSAGRTTTFEHKLNLEANRELTFMAVGMDKDENEYEAVSDKVMLAVEGTGINLIAIQADPDAWHLEEGRKLSFAIQITNKMSKPLTGVVVSEVTRGEIERFNTFVAGDRLVPIEYEVKEDSTFKFKVTGMTESGTPIEQYTDDINITVGALPSTSAIDTSTPADNGVGSLVTIIIIIAVLIVIVVVVLIVLMVQEKKAKALEAEELKGVESASDDDVKIYAPPVSRPPDIIEDFEEGATLVEEAEPAPEEAEEAEATPKAAEPDDEKQEEKPIDDIENPR